MANLHVLDAVEADKYLKTTGAGTDLDPHIPEHLETNSADLLAAAQAIQAAAEAIQTAVETLDNIVAGTEAQVDVLTMPTTAVTGPLTDTQLRASAVPVSGTVTASGPLTDTQLRNTAVPVSAAALPLPTGAATSAKQDTAAGKLDSLLTELQAKADLAETQPVSLAALPALAAGTAAIGKLAANSGVDIGDVDVTTVAIPASIYHGQTAVTTAGTEVALASSQTILSGVTIKAKAANTGIIYVGANPVTSSTGFALAAGEQVFLEVANLATVYIDASVNGEGVSYLAS